MVRVKESDMRRFTGIVAGIFFMLGMAVLLYHPVQTWMSRRSMQQEARLFEQAAAQDADFSAPVQDAPEKYPELLAEMQRYNEEIYESRQSGLTDAWSYEQAPFDFSEYGLSGDAAGVLKIPAMDQELPVYLGATRDNMAKGVAILGQTSMPVGGVNTNCVIAGHRGYGSTPFLREIEVLKPGDPVFLTTFWGEKRYEVESTAVILPTDIDAVQIQEGRELLTLVTCHPYIEATHRYVVYCEAVPEETASSSVEAQGEAFSAEPPAREPSESESASRDRIWLETRLPFLAVPLLILAILILVWPRKKKHVPRNRRRKTADEKDHL